MAQAQLNNAPFSFSNGGGPGMSVGGRQAILNEEVRGERPDNLLRAPSGELLEVEQVRGRSALVTEPGTTRFIPQYRGGSFRSADMRAGVFNGFFSPTLFPRYSPFIVPLSGATINTWTSRVAYGVPVYATEGNVVDLWTGQVFTTGY